MENKTTLVVLIDQPQNKGCQRSSPKRKT